MTETARRTSQTPDRDLLKYALSYASKGWKVIPLHNIMNDKCTCSKGSDCNKPGKHPRAWHGSKDATVNENIIKDWWAKYPNANIGIVTGKVSGIVALDVDPANGGLESFLELIDKHDPLTTLTQQTGGDGFHYIFNYPEGINLNNSASKLGKGLDIRANGGYIVAPPSNHISGGEYKWLELDNNSPNDLPTWLLEKIHKPKERNENNKVVRIDSVNKQDKILEGSRNNTLARIAGKLRQQGKNKHNIEIELLQVNEQHCTPPLDIDEVMKIAESIASYPVGNKECLLYNWRDYIKTIHGPEQSTTRHVLLALSSYMDKDGKDCYPSQEQLAKETGLSKKTVSKHLQIAQQEGWIKIIPHKGKGQAWKNNIYLPTIPKHLQDESIRIETER